MLFIVSLKIYDFIVFRNYENLQMEGTSVISGSDASVLIGDTPPQVNIFDALSEIGEFKFTVHTRTGFKKSDFIWFHVVILGNINYAGFIIPPKPYHPDFDASREKL